MIEPNSTPTPTSHQCPSDVAVVIDAAAALEMREIDLFRLAYQHRWGQEIEPDAAERLFAAFMFDQSVPVWVLDLSRDILARRDRNTLAPLRLEASHYRRLPSKARHGRLIVASVILGGFAYAAMLTGTGYDPGTSAPIFCHRGTGFEVISNLAHSIHGRPPPPCQHP